MISKLLFIFILATLPLLGRNSHTDKKYYLSVTTMLQNEGPYIKEWIEYHRLLGVEHFYLYDNDSDDNFMTILKPYIAKGIVEVKHWHSRAKHRWVRDQTRAFNHCIRRCKGETEWLAVIDIDEFLVPVIHKDLISFLSSYDNQPNIGGIRINWQLYGTSWLKSMPEDKLLIESLLWKAPTDYISEVLPHNGIIKSIVKPHAVKKYHNHQGEFLEGYSQTPTDEEKELHPVQVDTIRINHYWTRAEDFFYKTKLGQRVGVMGEEYRDAMIQKIEELNQVEDNIILKFAPQLRKKMGLATR